MRNDILEFRDAAAEFADFRGCGVAVDHGAIADLAGLVGPAEGVDSFGEVGVGGRDAGKHEGLGVAAEGVFEETRERGLAVGNVALVGAERLDHLAEGRERLVD